MSSENLFASLQVCVIADKIGPRRLHILRNSLEKHGATVMTNLLPNDNPIVVVVDETVDDRRVQQLHDMIDPSKDTIVTSAWVSESVKDNVRKETRPYERLSNREVTVPIVDLDDDGDKPSPSKKPRRYVCEYPAETKPKMPLGTNEGFDEGTTEPPTTDTKPQLSVESQNALITSQLKILSSASRSTNDKWRALAYDKAIKQIERITEPITSREQVLALPGVGAKIADKICEIMETGRLRKADAMASDERVQTMQLFNEIWGVGPTKANEWYQLGYRTLDDIQTKAKLTSQQAIGVKLFDDLAKRMPRHEAGEIAAVVVAAARNINPRLICTTCGSYRRGKPNCGDVDILITHPDGHSHATVLAPLVARLEEHGFLTDHLVQAAVEGNHQKYMGVCRLPGDNSIHRRLDIITVPYKEYAPSLVYFTGSAHFTRSIYAKAKARGWRLNQHGLRGGVMRAGGETLNEGYEIETPTEESIFEALGLDFLTPEQRDHV